MKATELMIGDWVLWKNKPVQVVRVSGIKYEFNHYDVLLAYCNDRGDGIECHDISSISPIPLTPEILEKNGFKKTQKTNDYSIWGFLIGNHYDNSFTPFVFVGCATCDLQYVHQLQQALRLAGRGDVAENFKI